MSWFESEEKRKIRDLERKLDWERYENERRLEGLRYESERARKEQNKYAHAEHCDISEAISDLDEQLSNLVERQNRVFRAFARELRELRNKGDV